MIDSTNFHLQTKGCFSKCNTPDSQPDYISFSDLEKSTNEFQNIVDEEYRGLNELAKLSKEEYPTYLELRKTKEGKLLTSIFNNKIKNLFNL